jgi:subtilisin family serine protease
MASGFVAGAAALVRERQPVASAEAVVNQLTATATPVGPPGSPEFGHGLVNPYSAVTTNLVAARSETLSPPLQTPARSMTTDRQNGATVATAIGLTAALALALGSGVVARGRRGGWRPSTRSTTQTWPEPPEPGPPLELFQNLDTKP